MFIVNNKYYPYWNTIFNIGKKVFEGLADIYFTNIQYNNLWSYRLANFWQFNHIVFIIY